VVGGLDEKYKRQSKHFATHQDQDLVYQTYQNARRENLKLKNKILIRNGFRPHLTHYTVKRLDLDLTNIDLRARISTSLRLPNAKLTELPSDVFSKYRYIKLLDISNNFLKTIDPRIGIMIPSLEKLIISNNKLEKFSLDLLVDLPALRYLDITENPLDQSWVKKLLAYSRIVTPKLIIQL
jgi:hypothetical protein